MEEHGVQSSMILMYATSDAIVSAQYQVELSVLTNADV